MKKVDNTFLVLSQFRDSVRPFVSTKVGDIPKVGNNTFIGVNNGKRSVLPRKAPRRCGWLRVWNTFPTGNSNRADQFRRMFICHISANMDLYSSLGCPHTR